MQVSRQVVAVVAIAAVVHSPTIFAASAELASANPLVAVDRHRSAIVADIVEAFRDPAVRGAGPLAQEELARLHSRLSFLRADKLLAASLASSYAALQVILNEAEAPPRLPKALGSSTDNLVYTPVRPCRLVDTRGPGLIAGGPFEPDERRQYKPEGRCGLPIAGIAAIMTSVTTQNLTPDSGGTLRLVRANEPDIRSLGTSDIFNLGSTWSASSAIVATTDAGDFDVFVEHATAEVIVDVLGYFGPAVFTATQLLPTSACQVGQIPKWRDIAGSKQWACAADDNVDTGILALNPGPGLIASLSGDGRAASIGLTSRQFLPTCETNQVVKWAGSSWVCAADLVGGAGVTSITAGSGLDGGMITSEGTIAVKAGGIVNSHLQDGAVTAEKLAQGALPAVEWTDTADGELTIVPGQHLTVSSPACPVSTFVVSGACARTGAFVYLHAFGAENQAWTCLYYNQDQVSSTIRARARCMALPAAAK